MRSVYLNFVRQKYNIGELKEAFKKFGENNLVVSVILTELNIRRDEILFNEEISSDEKIGALKQLRELVSYFSGDVGRVIQSILTKEKEELSLKNKKIIDNLNKKNNFKNNVRK